MANNIYDKVAIPISKGIGLDTDPLNQPKGSDRFRLNAVEEENGSISNEKSNIVCSHIPNGYYIIGDVYLGDNTSFVICVDPINSMQDLGIIDKNDKYTTIVNTGCLGLNITKQCDIIYRLRKNKERVVYWTDALNVARSLNLDKLYKYHNNTYKTYLKNGGDLDTYLGEKWENSAFNLVKTFETIPTFTDIEVLNNGTILPGSYSFAIQYVDEDLNPTAWATTSNTVNIFNDSTDNSYETIRGSRNIISTTQNFPRANKTIKLTLGNFDTNFPFYRVAIIRSANNIGVPDKVLVSELFNINESVYQYSGNDSSLTETTLESVLVDNAIIFAPKHIDQQENRLILASTEDKNVDWCSFQPFASKIASNCVTKEVILNSVESEANIKNARSSFMFKGYMPMEVYSFGICYVFNDGYISPAFHIPGKHETSSTNMQYHEITNVYSDVHDCVSDYWGYDAKGFPLVNTPIRHHRFPTRYNMEAALATRSTGSTPITKYKLVVRFDLTGSYPLDGSGNPVVVSYSLVYKPNGGSPQHFSGIITSGNVGTEIIVYDETIDLNAAYSTYTDIDSYCELLTTYPTDFTKVEVSYGSYVAESVINADIGRIFGINFTNIEKPHPDVVGFYIVRNERLDNDRYVVDSAILGRTTQEIESGSKYTAFGLLTPTAKETFIDCYGDTVDYQKQTYHDPNSLWFFSPEHQFLNKTFDFSSIQFGTAFTGSVVKLPTISNTDNSPCNNIGSSNGGSKGVYISDVQAGTTYNPDVNTSKNEDDDGFDLIIGYRSTSWVTHKFVDSNSLADENKNILKNIYLNSSSYQIYNSKTYYNVSADNKIGIVIFDEDILSNYNEYVDSSNTNIAIGILLRDNTSSYSNFINRSYYKEHNNLVLFENENVVPSFTLYNGDVYISPITLTSTIYYNTVAANRAKKSSVWKIVVGAILVAASIVLTVTTLGASIGLTAATISALSTAALSYGVALASAGFKFEQFKAMTDTDYDLGLRDTITDDAVFKTVRDGVDVDDDTIRWFSDSFESIYIESAVPIGLRTGLTCGIPDFVNSPKGFDEISFRSYLTEKFTVLDREQGSGRLYRGYPTAEVYDINLDYMRFNKEKIFYHLPLEYDCCPNGKIEYPNRVWNSEQSFQEEKTDNYRVFLPNSYRDIEGESGEITDIFRFGNNLHIHTREALWQLPTNNQERVTSEIVSFIGTGAFFSIPPRKILDDSLGSGGTQHKWATIKTPYGVVFISELEHKVYLYSGESLIAISDAELVNHFYDVLISELGKQLYDEFGIIFTSNNNTANPTGTGYISTYDSKYKRLILTKKDYSILPNKLANLTIVQEVPYSDLSGFTFCLENNVFYQGRNIILLDNSSYFEDKSFTMSYSFDSKRWISWHSYLPNYYIRSRNSMYSFILGSSAIWKHNIDGSHQKFYNKYCSFIVEGVISDNPIEDRIISDLLLQTNAKEWDNASKQYRDVRFITFNKLTLYNSRQSTGQLNMIVKDTKTNPQDWYAQQVKVTDNKDILITRKGRDWHINNFRDFVVNYNESLFTKDWAVLKNEYFIDKVVNNNVIDYGKLWHELESLKDKYIVFRLEFSNFETVNLSLNYIVETVQSTFR